MAALNKILLSDNITELGNVKSVVFSETVNSDVNLRPGCVASASIEVEVFNTQANAVAAGDVVYYYQNDKNNTPTLIGKFNCEPSVKTKNSYRFVAYDNAQKLNADFSQWLRANQSNFPKTVKQLVQQACTIAGVTLGSTSWPLSTQNVQAFYADGLTCRDIISYAAEIACKFVRCHTDGKLYFDWYTSNSNSIAPSAGTNQYAYKQDGLTYANFTTTALARVAVHPSGEDDVAYIYPVNVTSGNTLDIKDNLLLTGADASFYNSVAQTVYTAMHSLGTYRPMTASLFPRENPFRAGDIVSVTDSQSVTFTAPITGQTVSNSAATLESVGNETYTDYSGSTKGLTQLASDIVRINKLKVDWAEINTAIINYLTAHDVTAQNLTIVDENDNVIATFNSSGITFYNGGVAIATYNGNAVVLGSPSESHAEIDFNSFTLYDKNGNVYTSIGDARDANGEADIVLYREGTGNRSTFLLLPSAVSASSVIVKLNGTVMTSGVTIGTTLVRFDTTPSVGDQIEISYKTTDRIYHFDTGTRKSGTTIGAWSTVSGCDGEASDSYATICGGRNNTASYPYAVVAGGISNTARNDCASIAGGYGNVVNGGYSFVGGGLRNNVADCSCSVVCGGGENSASGNNSAVLGGHSNTASAQFSAVWGDSNTASAIWSSACGGKENSASGIASVVFGEGNNATSRDQLVFGCYNAAATNAVEIVGNGTDDNNRSNARTLDMWGNEYIAGDIYVQGGNRLTPVHVSISSFSSLPKTYSDAKIKSGMRMFNPVWGTPANAPNDCTYTTADGSLTISGTIAGATTFECDLIFCN